MVLRKRNNSSSEPLGDGSGSSLLAHPSAALERLVALAQDPTGASGALQQQDPMQLRTRHVLVRPLLAFIFQQHDLHTLAAQMRRATRRAAARAYAMQALNWLLRSVSQPTALHDLLWCLVASLAAPFDPGAPGGHAAAPAGGASGAGGEHEEGGMLEHPLADLVLAGASVQPLPQAFHQLLQTVADLMMLLPWGSPLQLMAVRCWGLRFGPQDHHFLHASHVFSNISKILSRYSTVVTCSNSLRAPKYMRRYE